jgi:hypothetical protein
MNLYLVNTAQGEIYVLADEEWNARDKVNEYMKIRYFGGSQNTIINIKLIGENEPERTNKKLIL